MLTEEQIKNLKPGDSLIMRGTYIKQYSNGDIIIKCNITSGGKPTPDLKYFHPDYCSLPSKDLKYDPCRKFKKGDKVRVVERDGRSPILCGAVELGGTYTVHADEDDGDVILDIGYGVNGGESIAWTFLELVTPVEELEPYSVKETMCHDGWQIVRDGLPLAIYDSRRHPNAKAAAEDECNRLNAEYRKKHQK